MAVRYSDIDIESSGARDFVIRRRQPSTTQIALIFLIALAIALSVTVTVANKYLLVSMLMTLAAVTGWYVVLHIQRDRDLLLATEFQNALFASALGLNNKFCMIMKREGNIVYLDKSFQDMFPDFLKQPRRSLDVLLDQGKVSREDSEKIYSAVERGVYEKVIFSIRGSSNESYKIVMSIEPILRPSGFVLLRGREFVETRASNEAEADNNLLNKSTVTLFSHIVDNMNMGIYMTGPTGVIIYANPLLENWLGFEEGEIISSNLSLPDIIFQNGEKPLAVEPENFEGELTLHKKNGGQMKAFINQKIIRDDRNKLLGCTTLVHNVADHTQELKKKMW